MSKNTNLMCSDAVRHIRAFRERYLDQDHKIRNTTEIRLLAVAIYGKAMQLTNKTKTVRDFHLSVESLARHYGASTKSVHAAILLLVNTGWFICALKGGFQKDEDGNRYVVHNPKTGRLMANSYIPVEHSKWAKTHPGKCAMLDSPMFRKGKTGPMVAKTITGRMVAKTTIQSSINESTNLESTTEATASKTCKPAADQCGTSQSKSKSKPKTSDEEKDLTFIGKPHDWVPLDRIREMVYEVSGVKPYFATPVLLELKRLAAEYGPQTVLDGIALAVRDAQQNTGFHWEGFAGWLVKFDKASTFVQLADGLKNRPTSEGERRWAN